MVYTGHSIFILLSCCIQGKLLGRGEEESLPTLAIIAYYDASGLVTVSIIFNAL